MKKIALLLALIAASASLVAAETVAKFASLEAGAKSLGYTVAAHESGGGFCVTGGKSWSITDGVTVVLKYSGLPSTGDQVLVTLAQSNDANYLSKVGIGASNGVLKGVWQGSLWNGGETTGKTLPESGTIVFVYHPDQSTRGVFTYDAEGTEVFKAKALKANGTGATLGTQFDFGSTHAGSLSTDGFVIKAVEILKGAVGQDDVAAVLANFEKTSAEQAFVSQVGTSASGWFSDWTSEKNGGVCKIVGTNGTVVTARKIDGAAKYHPYISESAFSTKEKVLLSFYGTTDFMATPATGKMAVLWNFGRSGNCNALALDENRHLVFVHSAGTTVSKRIDAGEAPKGYHLYTVVFDKDKGCGVYIDANAGAYDATFTSVPGDGWQVGSIYGGGSNLYVKGDGFVPLTIWASEDAFIPMIDQLAQTYPAVTIIEKTFAVDAYGETVYLPSLTVPNGCQLRVLRGTLVVPASVEATLGGLEFGDVNTGNLGFGMVLDGTINIVNDRVFDSNDAKQAYDACNEGRGVNFGEWAGQGTFAIRGTFNAPNTVVELVYDAAKVTVNVDGGTLNVKGIAAKNPDHATINLTNGGTISYGAFPSCAGVVKNYGSGTVTGTSSWVDSDSFTISGTKEDPTVFAADGVTLKFTGDISLAGAYRIDTANDGVVELHVMSVFVDGTLCDTLDKVAAAVRPDSVVVIESGVTKEQIEALGGITLTDNGEGGYTVALAMATDAALRFSEIMPKPVDKPVSAANPASLARYDENGLESGWVELENTSDRWVDLKDYKFLRVNRSKATSKGDYGAFPSVLIPPHGRYVFYTSERYANSADMTVSAWATPDPDGIHPKLYGEDLHNMLVWPDKINPKKFPFVRLMYGTEIVDTVVIPSDIPEGCSIIVTPVDADQATVRYLTKAPTKGAANPADLTGLEKLGPNVGPLYEIAGGAKHDSVSEFGAVAPAKPGEDYTVTFALNPTMHPTVAADFRAKDAIAAIKMIVRSDMKTETEVDVDLATKTTDAADQGDLYTAVIPQELFPAAGHLIQWKFKVTDAAGNEWTTPSFHNKDDGYEWYGTIVEPGADLVSAKLPTWHMFVEGQSLSQMDVDADKQDLSKVPNNARVAIYDNSTSNYYDYVRIDLRGNTSSHFTKKSHGLRFAKAHPLMMTDVVTGKPFAKEIRKSSLIGEPADPSFMRQMVAFWLWDRMGNKVPFDFPVRCNLNGAFYQLAFHSERFTDELIEDVYGFDKFGYGYKNVGTLKSNSGTTAGGIEKKTPDDGNESDISVLQNELRAKITAAGDVTNSKDGSSTAGLDNAALTKFVVEKFDLPAWLNYLASARITQEMDDVWANVSIYYDNAEMKEGARGTGTWMPLGYDFNLTFGQWYYNDVGSGSGLMATNDWFKSHPFYGGNRVRCYKQAAMTTTCNDGNNGFEAVWQSAKFRRLYLRRLRTLMDQELKEPGTAEEDVPFMAKMRELAALMEEDAVLDRKRWPHDGSIGNIDVWRGEVAWPATMKDGIDDIWNNYVVPRQTHLYVTHSVTNTSKEIGYASTLNAGIPLAQSSLDVLKEGLSAEAVDGGVVIRNANDEAVDLSGWDVTGPVVMKLPAGTVVDRMANGKTGEVFVVTDRRAYVAAHAAALTDEVIVGNATAGSGTDVGLAAADGTVVLSADVILPPGTYHGLSYDVPVRLAPAGSFAFEGVAFNGGLTMGEGSFTLKNQSGFTNTASVVDAPAANIVFTGKGAFELKGEKESLTLMTVNDLYVSNGVFTVESKATTPETAAVCLNGGFAVEDKGTVNLKLTKNAAQGRGFYIASSDTFCRIGKGGTFNAELNGPGCRAIQGNKGSVNLTVKEGAKVKATGSAKDARYFKMKGHIKVSGGTVDLKATGAGTELLSSDKNVEISGGELHLESTDDCVNAATAITISGGTIHGTSTGGDVFDSNGTLAVMGGSVVGLAIGTEADGRSGQVFDVNAPNAVDFTDSTATVFAISGIDASLGVETAAEAISGKTIRTWTAPVLEGVETVKLFMMVDGRIVARTPESWDEIEVTEATTIGELVTSNQVATLAALQAEPAKIVEWAKAHSTHTKPGEAIDLEAFAFDCAPTEVEAKKKAFKVTISFDENGKAVVTKAEGVSLNVEPTIKGSADLIDWHDKAVGDRFFKAVIHLGEERQ